MDKIRDIVNIVLGNLMIAVAVSYFVVPFEILSGGVAGVAVAISPIVPLSTPTIINIIILSTFIMGGIFLGKVFILKTTLSSILYPLFLKILGYFPIAMDISPMLASLYAGAIGGVGIGLVFRQEASTGGMDIFPLIIHKYTKIRLSTLVLIVDGLTVLLGLVTHGVEAVLIGLISVYATGVTIDKVVIAGGAHAKTVYIISEEYQQILESIHKELDRGATIIAAKGGFTGTDRTIILSVVPANQYPTLQHIVDRYDKNAFMIVSDATDVRGEGFSIEAKI